MTSGDSRTVTGCSTIPSPSYKADTDDWYRAAVSVAAALAVGSVLATVALSVPILEDPIDVVGRPLIDGYSERSEQLAWLLFAFSSFVVPVVVMVAQRWLSVKTTRSIGLAALALTLPVVSVGGDYLRTQPHLLLVLAVTATAMWIGRSRVPAEQSPSESTAATVRERTEAQLWVAGMLLLLGYRYFPLELPAILVVAAVILVLVVVVRRRDPDFGRSFVEIFRHPRVSMFVRMVVIAGWVILFPSQYYAWLVLAAGACLLGGLSAGFKDTAACLVQPATALSVLCVSLGVFWLNWFHPADITISSALLLMITSSAVAMTVSRCHNSVFEAVEMLSWNGASTFVTRSLLLISAGLSFWVLGWWCGLLVSALLLWFDRTMDRHPDGCRHIIVVACLLLAAFVPTIEPVDYVDRFHDGQILSAVWEVESGKTAYSDVFPLRSFQFYVCWLGQQVLPPTFEWYRAVQSLLTFVPVAAGALVGFVWTRSVWWALALAMVVATQDMFPRQGALWVLAALTMEILRNDRRSVWWLLAIPGVLAGMYGFDGIGPLALAATGSVLLTMRWKTFDQSFRRLLWARIKDLAIVLTAMPGVWTLLLVLVAGPRAGATFWTLFIDMSGHLNAFFGLPITLHQLLTHSSVVPLLVLLTIWNVAYVHSCACLSEARRRVWLFVSLFVIFSALRAVGRSDYLHFDCVVYPAVVLGVLLLFELTRMLRGLGFTHPALDANVVVAVCLAVAIWNVPHQPGTPASLYADLAAVPRTEVVDLETDPFVLETVSDSESFWPLEDGLATYTHRRRNPTRHAIAYAMSTPDEQRVAVHALENDPPALISWPEVRLDMPNKPLEHVIDEIAPPLRYYIMAPWIYAHYRPSKVAGYLERADTGRAMVPDSADTFRLPLDMGRLPYSWGMKRLNQLEPVEESDLPLAPTDDSTGSGGSSRWTAVVPPNGSRFNYLLLKLRATARPDNEFPWIPTTLQIDGTRELPERTQITFGVSTQGEYALYLIPIGCSPDWIWPSPDSTVVIENSHADLDITECRLLQIDERR